MPEPTCPFCEAPFSSERTRPAITKGEKEVIPPTVLKHWSCGTFSTPRVHDSEQCFMPSELCIARQRLFDDVLARCISPLVYQNSMDLNTGLSQTVAFFALEPETAFHRARAAVAARYPLPIKDAADANAK